MSDGLDTGIPAWLQNNWRPKEPFDPTPWLQERYKRQIEAQTIPLQLQGMALQNQQAQLAIQHQGLVNEMQGMQLQQYQDESPRLQGLLKQYATDPVGLMNHVESFQSPIVQKQWLDAKAEAAKTQVGLAAIEQGTQKWIAARQLMVSPGAPPMQLDQNGNPSEEWLSAASAAKQAAEERMWTIRTGWHYDAQGNPINTSVTPQVQTVDFNGKKVSVLVNPKTGHFQSMNSVMGTPAANKAEIAINAARIKDLYKAHDALAPEVGAVTEHPNTIQRMRIMDQINQLKQRNRELDAGGGEGETPAAASSAPLLQFVPGKGIVPVEPAPEDATAPETP